MTDQRFRPDTNRENLRQFYEEQKEISYYQYQTVTTHVVTFDSRDRAEEQLKRYRDGTDFHNLAPEMLVRVYYRDEDGVIRTRHSLEELPLGEIAIQLDTDEIAGPLSYQHSQQGTRYALVKCVRIREEKQLSFDISVPGGGVNEQTGL
ncbi:peptidylprolyl isomerase [Balneolales bacterium ANBcel1]|nr:peptidylprolyl isomerase [Balneolales bacterium ANBcel1]